jgi:hypothetical protein
MEIEKKLEFLFSAESLTNFAKKNFVKILPKNGYQKKKKEKKNSGHFILHGEGLC